MIKWVAKKFGWEPPVSRLGGSSMRDLRPPTPWWFLPAPVVKIVSILSTVAIAATAANRAGVNFRAVRQSIPQIETLKELPRPTSLVLKQSKELERGKQTQLIENQRKELLVLKQEKELLILKQEVLELKKKEVLLLKNTQK
jgi:hypothetical protein